MPRVNDTDVDVEDVLTALNIEIQATRGSWIDALCPFHDESKPSFSVNINSGYWICRHYNLSGNVVDLVSEVKELEKSDSFIWLRGFKPKQYSSYDLLKKLIGTRPDERNEELINWIAEFHELPTTLMTEYWFGRGFTSHTMHSFDVRYDDNRKGIIWPVKDTNANIIGFIRRHLPGINPKYKYPSGFQRCLFPMDKFEQGTYKGDVGAVLVEGPLDAMWLHQYGATHTLAMLGSGLTQNQINWLNKKVTHVTIIPDNDAVGEAVVKTLRNQLSHLELCVARIPKQYKDIQEVPARQIGGIFKNRTSIFTE